MTHFNFNPYAKISFLHHLCTWQSWAFKLSRRSMRNFLDRRNSLIACLKVFRSHWIFPCLSKSSPINWSAVCCLRIISNDSCIVEHLIELTDSAIDQHQREVQRWSFGIRRSYCIIEAFYKLYNIWQCALRSFLDLAHDSVNIVESVAKVSEIRDVWSRRVSLFVCLAYAILIECSLLSLPTYCCIPWNILTYRIWAIDDVI